MQVFSTPRRSPVRWPSSRVAVQTGAILLMALFLIVLAVLPVSARTIPAFKGYVNDYANMISGPTKATLEHTLKSFERTDTTQIAVLTVDSLEGDPLEDFSIRVAEKWGIGQKGKDNGVLLLIAKKERRARLEVGYGLEGVLTDLLAGRIIDDIITPRFKSGQFDQGFEAGVEAVIQATRGEFKADQTSSRRGGRRQPSPLISYLFFGGFFISFLGQFSRKVGIVAGAITLPVAVLLASSPGWLILFLLIPVGALAGLLLSIISPVFLSGGGSSSGGGFGGFSGGGGGSFGGGGASGGW